MRSDIARQVTKAILDRLREGVVPWVKPWAAGMRPRNLVTGRPYHGVNAVSLGQHGRSPYWLTYVQAQKSGWQVREGSKGVPILFASERWVDVPQNQQTLEGPAKRRVPFVKVFHVFNALDVDGVPEDRLAAGQPNNWDPIVKAEEIVRGCRPAPRIEHGGDRAFYARHDDHIMMPPRTSFDKAEDYYSVLFHELTHWTGHESRLNRQSITLAARFGDANYGQEELVAEFGAGFLGAEAALPPSLLDRSASYIDNWLHAIRAQPQMVVRAASEAELAASFLLGP